jgi:hypothetical protein
MIGIQVLVIYFSTLLTLPPALRANQFPIQWAPVASFRAQGGRRLVLVTYFCVMLRLFVILSPLHSYPFIALFLATGSRLPLPPVCKVF